ncbi:MAG: RNA polymerase sigma factor [Nocardioidaceae bacterium]
MKSTAQAAPDRIADEPERVRHRGSATPTDSATSTSPTASTALRLPPDHATDHRGDDALGRAAALGDRAAFEVIVRTHGPAMYRYARHMLSDEGDVHEVVQDAFVAAWKGLPRFQGRSTLRTWLFSLTAHKAIDVRRKSRPQPVNRHELIDRYDARAGEANHPDNPETTATNAALVSAIEQALTALPYRQRACWLLVEVEGMSQRETAEALSMSSGAVRGQVARASRTLAERMAQWR